LRPRDWRLRIQDILEAAQQINGHIQALDFEVFAGHRLLIEAIFFNLAIIGEAASHVPIEIQMRHPELTWDDMRSNRNIIIHEYFRVNLRIVWDTVSQDLPALIPRLQAVLEAEVDAE
jgi:uncharacterized protein with HEPN domain